MILAASDIPPRHLALRSREDSCWCKRNRNSIQAFSLIYGSLLLISVANAVPIDWHTKRELVLKSCYWDIWRRDHRRELTPQTQRLSFISSLVSKGMVEWLQASWVHSREGERERILSGTLQWAAWSAMLHLHYPLDVSLSLSLPRSLPLSSAQSLTIWL